MALLLLKQLLVHIEIVVLNAVPLGAVHLPKKIFDLEVGKLPHLHVLLQIPLVLLLRFGEPLLQEVSILRFAFFLIAHLLLRHLQ